VELSSKGGRAGLLLLEQRWSEQGGALLVVKAERVEGQARRGGLLLRAVVGARGCSWSRRARVEACWWRRGSGGGLLRRVVAASGAAAVVAWRAEVGLGRSGRVATQRGGRAWLGCRRPDLVGRSSDLTLLRERRRAADRRWSTRGAEGRAAVPLTRYR
jgi:hypothetical protein